MTADTIEGCSCPLFCGCYFNGEPNDPHMCQFNNVYKFRPGSHYGGVDLSGAVVWMSGDLGGEWGKSKEMPTEWVTITFDKKVTPEQRQAVSKVFAKVFPVQWKKTDVREDDIEWNDQGPTKSARQKGGKAEISLAMVKGADHKQGGDGHQEPAVLGHQEQRGLRPGQVDAQLRGERREVQPQGEKRLHDPLDAGENGLG